MAKKRLDLTGKNFGRLLVLEEVEERKNGGVQWLCKCSCGNTCVALGGNLKSGGKKSCGCLKEERSKNKIDLTGKRFNMLTVIKESTERKNNEVSWLCKCDCGNRAIATTGSLRRGQKSCGCLVKKGHANTKKGLNIQTTALILPRKTEERDGQTYTGKTKNNGG